MFILSASAAMAADYTVTAGNLLTTGTASNLAAFNGHYVTSGTSLVTLGYDTTNDCGFIRSEQSNVAWKPLKLSASTFTFNFGWHQLFTLTSDGATQTTATYGASDIPALLNVMGGGAIGTGVSIGEWGQTTVGRYNDTRTNDAGTNHTQGVLVVGTGTADNNRANAMRVLSNGTILIAPSGDISMGSFTNGQRP